MTEVLIYKPTKTPPQKILPKLLESVIAKGNNVHILCSNDEQVKTLDDYLWTYEQLSFLPHATYQDDLVEKQPIVLSINDNNLNNASVLVLNEPKLPQRFSKYAKVIYICDIEEKDSLDALQKECANNNLQISSFVQYEKGWEKK